jgi:hypothetical protein
VATEAKVVVVSFRLVLKRVGSELVRRLGMPELRNMTQSELGPD